MINGSRGVCVVLGLALCALFAGGAYVGGWPAFGVAAACAVICIAAAVAVLARREKLLERVLAQMASPDGGEPQNPDNILLGYALRAVAENGDVLRSKVWESETAFKELRFPALRCDAGGVIREATQPLYDLLGKKPQDVIGVKVGQAFYNRDSSFVSDRVLGSKEPVSDTLDVTLWNGRAALLEITGVPLWSLSGERRGAVVSLADRSKLVAQQREIENQQDRMVRAGEKISELAEHVAAATELLSASADDQAQGAQKQRNQTTSVAEAMREMTGTVLEVARNASATNDAAGQAHESAGEGASMVSRAVEAINEVSESADELGREVGELNTQAGEIGRIIGVINDIADQTNLLALNAAIEAARAGDAGRGFAVVADEVRKLAEKTMAATKEVEEAIRTIQTRSQHAMSAMKQTSSKVDESTTLSNQAGDALQEIMENVNDMVARISQIATAAEQQSAAAEEIMRSIGEISEIAGEADEAAGQAASATRDLAELAQELLNLSKGVRGGEVSESQLRQSEGMMKGILLKLGQEFVLQTYGRDAYDGMQEELGSPVFLPTDSYPDQVLMQMAELTSVQAGIPVRDFSLEFGKYSVKRFNDMYPRYFKNESLKEFYLRMNEVHAQLTKDNPGIKPPKFTYEDKGDDLFMNYRSSRGLFDYFEGILLGAASFKGEKVRIEVKPFDETSARAEIVFLGKK